MRSYLLVTCLLVGCASSEVVPDLRADVDGYSDAVEDLDRQIAAAEALAGDDWTIDARIASLRLIRARLVGGYGDYVHAQDALDDAFDKAVEGGGPHAVRARVLASLHRVDEAMADVDTARQRLLLSDRELASLDLLGAELRWSSGEHAEAAASVEAIEADLPSFASAASVGHHRWHTLDDAGAERAFDAAEAHLVGESRFSRSWLHLQRGLLDLDRGRYDEALVHYRDADAALPGWWLVHEHIAEILVLTDRTSEAEVIYRDVVDRTDAPEFMDALAGLALDSGDTAEAESWIALADDRYEAQIAAFPEAAAGHALDHYLEFGSPERALEIARGNVENRPNAEAWVGLAMALHNVDQHSEAVEAMEQARATVWRGGPFYDAAEVVYPAAGMEIPEVRPW